VLTAMMTAVAVPRPVLACMSTLNTLNLAYQPPSGGMPISEARNRVMATVMPGMYWNSPPNESISADRVLRAMAMTTAKAPRVMAA
jgi:uncharacterized membrane protein